MALPAGRAERFHRMHHQAHDSILVLPNAWDAMSARMCEAADAGAVGTTSAGVSWALGRPDGQAITADEMVAVVHRVARSVGIPVSADIESGYGRGSPEEVAATAAAVIDAGAVGINLEDAPGRGGSVLLEPEEQAERIAAARNAANDRAVRLFINARIDVYLRQVGDPSLRFEETVRRARAYTAAGADGVFVPGVVDVQTVGRLAAAIDAPLNIMAGPGAPSVAELRDLGVARVSVGPAMALATMARIRRLSEELLRRGTYETLECGLTFADVDPLFSAGTLG